MQAVVLTGGLGTRLGKLTSNTPKPLLPVGDKPFLSWSLGNVRRFGFSHTLLLAGQLGDQLTEFARGLTDVTCVVETGPLGTAGALHNAADLLADGFLLMNGDSLFDFNYLDLASRVPVTRVGGVGLRRATDASRYGSVRTSNGLVAEFSEKASTGPGLVNGGVYWLRRAIVDRLPQRGSLEMDVFPELPAGSLVAAEYDGFFIDIGTPEDYTRAQTLVPAHFHRPAAFLDRDGTLNRDDDPDGRVHTAGQFVWMPQARETIRLLNDLGYLVVVVTNQSGIGRGLYPEQDVLELHCWMNKALCASGAHVDAFYYCPHPPGTDCKCRKPEPGLILQAAADWNIDLARSVGCGDQPKDAEAFTRSGVGFATSSLDELRTHVSSTGTH